MKKFEYFVDISYGTSLLLHQKIQNLRGVVRQDHNILLINWVKMDGN